MVEVVQLCDVCAPMWLEFCWVQFSAFSRSCPQTGSCANRFVMLRLFPSRWTTLGHTAAQVLEWNWWHFWSEFWGPSKTAYHNQTCDYKKDGKFRLMENICFVNNGGDKLWLNWGKTGNHSLCSLLALMVLSSQPLLLCAGTVVMTGYLPVIVGQPTLSGPCCYTY